jgi:hypothetical protein
MPASIESNICKSTAEHHLVMYNIIIACMNATKALNQQQRPLADLLALLQDKSQQHPSLRTLFLASNIVAATSLLHCIFVDVLQGGANAGHTIYDENGTKYALHLLPSGVLNK